MKLALRALATLPALAFTTSLLAAGPSWSLKPGSEILLTPADGSASVSLLPLDATHSRLTLRARTTLLVTPDPMSESTSRTWVLPAGTELTVTLATGQTLRRQDLAHSVELEVSPDPGNGGDILPLRIHTMSVTPTTATSSLTVSPDPGGGDKYPPT